MRFTQVAERLRSLPNPLPPAPDVLTPQQLDEQAARVRASPGILRPSAVLVLVFPDEAGEARVLLTARPEADIRHPGQISFPGGATDPGDADPVATALREAREEVGLDTASAEVEVVGTLDPVVIPVSAFRLIPIVALAGRRPVLAPDPREVHAVFDAPVERFLPGARIELVERVVAGSVRIRYGAFDYQRHRIWGATARILGQLGAVLAPVAPASPDR